MGFLKEMNFHLYGHLPNSDYHRLGKVAFYILKTTKLNTDLQKKQPKTHTEYRAFISLIH